MFLWRAVETQQRLHHTISAFFISFPLSITSQNCRLIPFREKFSLFIGVIFSASYWIQQTHFTFTPFLSLSLSLGIELSLCFPQDLVKTGSFSNCTQLGMFLFYAFFSFHIHFLSVLSFWSKGFLFFKELFLYVCALNQSQ